MALKTGRLEMRLSSEQKSLLERAAALEGQPLTGFALSHLLERARDLVARHERTVLSRRDQERFLDLLAHPPAPTAALRAAFRRHRPARD